MNELFDQTVMVIHDEDINVGNEKPEAIYYYSFQTSHGEIRYTFLPKFVLAMSQLYPECQFAGYISNQIREEDMEIELAVTYKEETLLFSFVMHWLQKGNPAFVHTYFLNFEDDFFSNTELTYTKNEEYFRKILQDAMQYIENMPEYRLYFVTNKGWEITE